MDYVTISKFALKIFAIRFRAQIIELAWKVFAFHIMLKKIFQISPENYVKKFVGTCITSKFYSLRTYAVHERLLSEH